MEYFSGRLKIIIIISLFIILLLSGLFIYLFAYVWVKPPISPINQTVTEVQPSPFPQPEFKEWKLATNEAVVASIERSKVYTLKQEYQEDELMQISQELGLDVKPEIKGNNQVYIKTASESADLLIINKSNSVIHYLSTLGISLGNFDTISSIYSLLSKIGLSDQSITLTAQYELKNQPGVQYYEFHRDWQQFGYPILNMVGLLNLPDTQKLKNLLLTETNANFFSNENIYNSSDNKDGVERATDFNTVTVAVNKNSNRIVSLESNMRPLASEPKALDITQLLTQEEALNNLKSRNDIFFITMPSGNGAIDFSKVYPENKAVSDLAVIEETVIAYLENPEGAKQDFMKPHYIFKGYSDLTSGYRVRFIAAVSAIKDPNIAGTFIAAITPGVGGQQQNTLGFPDLDITATPTPIPTIISTNTPVPTITTIEPTIISTNSPTRTTTSTVTPSLTPTPMKDVCINYYNNPKNYVAKYEAGGYLYILSEWKDGLYQWEIVLNEKQVEEQDKEEILASIRTFFAAIKNYNYKSVGLTEANTEELYQRLIETVEKQFITLHYTCKIRVTGSSPTLFVYVTSGKRVTISPQFNVLYEEPSLLENIWAVQGNDDSLIQINNVNRPYIYYEYKPIVFSKPTQGWYIERNTLQELSKKIAKKLVLNSHETSRLLFELQHASSNINDQYLFVGLIPQDEIDDKLSLSVAPQIKNIQRYHFYVKGVNSKVSIKPPALMPIVRTEEMILELGAIKGN